MPQAYNSFDFLEVEGWIRYEIGTVLMAWGKGRVGVTRNFVVTLKSVDGRSLVRVRTCRSERQAVKIARALYAMTEDDIETAD